MAMGDPFAFIPRSTHIGPHALANAGSVGKEELSRLQKLIAAGDYQPAIEVLEICRQELILNDGPATALVLGAESAPAYEAQWEQASRLVRGNITLLEHLLVSLCDALALPEIPHWQGLSACAAGVGFPLGDPQRDLTLAYRRMTYKEAFALLQHNEEELSVDKLRTLATGKGILTDADGRKKDIFPREEILGIVLADAVAPDHLSGLTTILGEELAAEVFSFTYLPSRLRTWSWGMWQVILGVNWGNADISTEKAPTMQELEEFRNSLVRTFEES